MKVVWTEFADADLDGLVWYVADDSIANALALDARIRERVRMLAEFPDAGHLGRYPGTHELVIPNDRCVVVYLVDGDVVRVLRLIHGGQTWPDEL